MGEGSGGGGGSERQETCSAAFCLSQQVCHLFYHLLPTSLLLFKFFSITVDVSSLFYKTEFLHKCSCSIYVLYQCTLNLKKLSNMCQNRNLSKHMTLAPGLTIHETERQI